MCKKLWFCRRWVFLLSARLICSVVLLLCVFSSTEDSSMLPLKQGKGKLQKTVLQWDTCICMRNKTTLVPEKEKRAMTVCRQEGNKVGNKLITPFATSAEKKKSVLRYYGKKHTATSSQKPGWGVPKQECLLWQAVLHSAHGGRNAADVFVCPVSIESYRPFHTQPSHIRVLGAESQQR